MKTYTRSLATALAAIVLSVAAMTANATAWRGITDESGLTWARIRIVNQSSHVSNWSISNCRTATSSGPAAALTDSVLNWNGAVGAGESTYVWVYGVLDSAVYLDNADGGNSAYGAASEPIEGADGEWVVSIAPDGTVSTFIEPVNPYGLPNQSGTLPQ